ncbi:hypothetical protein [Nonomuraea sp. NPDC005650]|uniref:hypothetical protein n=1 Tax=Nonomuraea sp. NPDC005650 TaxID=3157045 RepID=UPI0033BBD3A9
MIRIRPRRGDEPKQAPRPSRVCVDGQQPATELARDGAFVTVELADGTTPSVLENRVSPCTCNGGGCRG